MLGEGVAHAFMRALVHIIGGYRDALKLKPGEQITFSDEAFIQSRPQSLQPFLEEMLQLQIFRQVSRLAALQKTNFVRRIHYLFIFCLRILVHRRAAGQAELGKRLQRRV